MKPKSRVAREGRRLKSGITRVRTGCYTCRRRKVKCDETKPECRACSQLGHRCGGYAPLFKFCDPQTVEAVGLTTSLVLDEYTPQSRSQPAKNARASQQPRKDYAISDSDSGGTVSNDSPLCGNQILEQQPSSPAKSDTPLLTNTDLQFSPANDAFVTSPGGLEFLRDANSIVQSPSWMHLSPDLWPTDGVSLASFGDTFQISTILNEILANTNGSNCQGALFSDICNKSDSSELYLDQWYTRVVDLLPPVFRDITTEMPDLPALRDAVLAISAAYLAHLESVIVRTTYRTRKTRYIPQRDHQVQSLQFYNRAIQGIRTCIDVPGQVHPVYLLASLLLFYYFELDSGSFSGGIGHITVIDKFLESHHKTITANATGRKLLRTWVNVRSLFMNRYLGGHRPSKPRHDINAYPLNCISAGDESDHDSVTIIMCDAKQLSRRIIIDWCVLRGDCRTAGNNAPVDNILAQMSLSKSREESVHELSIVDASYRACLEKEQARLDKWHSCRDLSDLPVDGYKSHRKTVSAHSTVDMDILPLKFHTFESAMRYAYYAHAQMLCSGDMLDRVKSPTFVEPPFSRADCPWVELVLRIAAGLNIADCIYKNTFSTGILAILTTCIVICPRADVAAWVEGWIRKVEDLGVPLESGLPFGLTKRIIRFILNQRQAQRDILLILPLDIEDTEKTELYHSDFKLQVVACGKDMHSGKLYHEILEIPEM